MTQRAGRHVGYGEIATNYLLVLNHSLLDLVHPATLEDGVDEMFGRTHRARAVGRLLHPQLRLVGLMGDQQSGWQYG